MKDRFARLKLITASDAFFKAHVSNGKVAYSKIKDNPEALNNLVDLAEEISVSKKDIKTYQAFWINAYNAYTLKLILDKYPLKSILNIKKKGKDAWSIPFANVGGKNYTLNQIEHEILRIELENKSDNIQASSTHVVHTTDLRLKLGRDMRNDGTKRPLIPLSNTEWSEVDRIIRKERQVIKVIDGSQKIAKLDIESAFMFLLERYTGIRREEMLTLRHSHIRLPNNKDNSLGYCPLDIGSQSNTKTKGEGNPDRTIHVPIGLMLQLHNLPLISTTIH